MNYWLVVINFYLFVTCNLQVSSPSVPVHLALQLPFDEAGGGRGGGGTKLLLDVRQTAFPQCWGEYGEPNVWLRNGIDVPVMENYLDNTHVKHILTYIYICKLYLYKYSICLWMSMIDVWMIHNMLWSNARFGDIFADLTTQMRLHHISGEMVLPTEISCIYNAQKID